MNFIRNLLTQSKPADERLSVAPKDPPVLVVSIGDIANGTRELTIHNASNHVAHAVSCDFDAGKEWALEVEQIRALGPNSSRLLKSRSMQRIGEQGHVFSPGVQRYYEAKMSEGGDYRFRVRIHYSDGEGRKIVAHSTCTVDEVSLRPVVKLERVVFE
jgi:hypothetical protein